MKRITKPIADHAYHRKTDAELLYRSTPAIGSSAR